MTTPRFCANCGYGLTPGLKFCPRCGQAIEGAQESQPAPAAPQAPQVAAAGASQPPAKNNTPLILGGAAVLVAIVAAFLMMSGGSSDDSSSSRSSSGSGPTSPSSAPRASSNLASYKLTIMVPAAWAHEDLKAPQKGRVTAAVAADITRERPQGPKVTAEVLDSAAKSVDPSSFIKDSKADNVTVLQQPKNVRVGQDEMEGVQIVLNETYGSITLTRVYIVAKHLKLGTYVLFTGEVPSSQFAAQERTLLSVADGAKLSQ